MEVNGVKYSIVEVTSKSRIEELSSISALTFEGMSTDDRNLRAIVEWLISKDATVQGSDVVFSTITGKLMNNSYNLKGSNSYPDDLTILSIEGINTAKLVLARFEVGGRWMDDVLYNNSMREEN